MNMHPAKRMAHLVVFQEMGDGFRSAATYDWDTGRWSKAGG